MSNAIVYVSAILFFIAIFPVHVLNYVFISTGKRYASFNVTVYRLFTIINLNTEKDRISYKKSDNGRQKPLMTNTNWLKLFNNLCITKIVQLGDYGIKNENNVYIALANNAFTNALFSFIKINGGKTKLKNYAILNYEHSYVNYYLKLAGVINVITLAKLFTVFIWGKLNEQT